MARLAQIVADYLAHCRADDERFGEGARAVTAMTFFSPPDLQWDMILEAIRQARDDKDLGHIAAGPIEGLLGWHGEAYIGLVEEQATIDDKFARAMTGVWRYMMTDRVWERVKAIQSPVKNPMPGFRKN
jgi:hypothetical protein